MEKGAGKTGRPSLPVAASPLTRDARNGALAPGLPQSSGEPLVPKAGGPLQRGKYNAGGAPFLRVLCARVGTTLIAQWSSPFTPHVPQMSVRKPSRPRKAESHNASSSASHLSRSVRSGPRQSGRRRSQSRRRNRFRGPSTN